MTKVPLDDPHPRDLSMQWFGTACENVGRWGNQSPALLFLAMVEELGEVAMELQDHTEPGDGLPPVGDYDSTPHDGRRLIADMAQLGRQTREYLEGNFDEPAGTTGSGYDDLAITGDVRDAEAIQDEVDDLAPLLYQLTWALQGVEDGD